MLCFGIFVNCSFFVLFFAQGDKQPLKKLAVGGGKCKVDDCHKVHCLTRSHVRRKGDVFVFALYVKIIARYV